MTLDRRFSVAPMQDWTDRHERYFLRLLTRRTLLYTEMIVAEAVLRGDRERLLAFDPAEHPVALQLGGAEPARLAEAAAIGEGFGYDEINLNVGCPSDRVAAGRFGVCLMAEPETVAAAVAAMRRAVAVPVTVKCRIGIAGRDSYEDLLGFVDRVAEAGCASFAVHARAAVLGGLSPRENREIPPLRYPLVHRLKRERPHLEIVVNGGLGDWGEVARQLAAVDGVMIGREAYRNPWFLVEADRRLWGDARPLPSRTEIVEALLPYVEAQRRRGVPLQAISRHLLGLFQGCPGARAWRRYLSENAGRPGAGPETLRQALALVAEPPAERRSA